MSLREAIRDLERALSRLDEPASARHEFLRAGVSALKDIDQRLVALEAKASPPESVNVAEGPGQAGTVPKPG
jgi:hypothetical protein